MKLPKIIAIDFDGTLVRNAWPKIGRPRLDVIKRIKEERANGAKIILWTCRTGNELTDAILFCWLYGIELDAVNENLPEIVDVFGSDNRKIYASEYWDDRAVLI